MIKGHKSSDRKSSNGCGTLAQASSLWCWFLCSFDCWGHGGASWSCIDIHAHGTASKLGQRVECKTECCAKIHGEIRPYFQCSNFDWVVQPKDPRFYGMLGCWSGRRCIGTWDGTCSAWTLAPCWWRSLRRLGPSWDAFLWFQLWTHEELFGAVLEPFLPRRWCPIYCNNKFPFQRWSSRSLSEKKSCEGASYFSISHSKEVTFMSAACFNFDPKTLLPSILFLVHIRGCFTLIYYVLWLKKKILVR